MLTVVNAVHDAMIRLKKNRKTSIVLRSIVRWFDCMMIYEANRILLLFDAALIGVALSREIIGRGDFFSCWI